jgi:hypothetical protein
MELSRKLKYICGYMRLRSRILHSAIVSLRAHPKSLDSGRGICSKSPEHDADHGDADEGNDSCGVAFEIASQTAIATDPGERNFLNCGMSFAVPNGGNLVV